MKAAWLMKSVPDTRPVAAATASLDASVPVDMFWQLCNVTYKEAICVLADLSHDTYRFYISARWSDIPVADQARLLRVMCEACLP